MRTRQIGVYAALAVVVLAAAVALVVAQRARRGESPGTEVAQAPEPGGAPDRDARRAQALQAMRERLTAAGATEADMQAIEAHRNTQRDIMQPLRQAMQSLREAAGEDATDAQAKQAVSQHETAMQTALSELAKAEEALKAQLNLSDKPKLHALLLTMGVLDNGMRGGRAGGAGEGRRGARGGGRPRERGDGAAPGD